MKTSRVWDKNGSFKLPAYKSLRRTAAGVCDLLKALEQDGWNREESEYLVMAALTMASNYQTMASGLRGPHGPHEWDELKAEILKSKHGNERKS